jgi:Recombinase
MLYNERYAGQVIWNRSKFVRNPETKGRVRQMRPPEEWRILEAEHLRIIPQALWKRVHERLACLKSTYAQTRPGGLLSRSVRSRYLFSGLLVLLGVRRQPEDHFGPWQTSSCPLWVSPELQPRHLHKRSQRAPRPTRDPVARRPAANGAAARVIYNTLDRFETELAKQLQALSGQMDGIRRRKMELESELQRLTVAVAQGGHSAFLLEGITERERELRSLNDQLVSGESGSFRLPRRTCGNSSTRDWRT